MSTFRWLIRYMGIPASIFMLIFLAHFAKAQMLPNGGQFGYAPNYPRFGTWLHVYDLSSPPYYDPGDPRYGTQMNYDRGSVTPLREGMTFVQEGRLYIYHRGVSIPISAPDPSAISMASPNNSYPVNPAGSGYPGYGIGYLGYGAGYPSYLYSGYPGYGAGYPSYPYSGYPGSGIGGYSTGYPVSIPFAGNGYGYGMGFPSYGYGTGVPSSGVGTFAPGGYPYWYSGGSGSQ